MKTNNASENNLISVIIPTFQRSQFIKRAIDSVLAQTYPNFKIYIYDNASLDQTRQIVQEYSDKRIEYYVHAKNIGLNNNYNFALSRVDTPFFVFLSDDDLFMPTFLEEAMKGFENYPNAGLFIGGMIYMDKKKRLLGAIVHQSLKSGHFSSEEILEEIVRGRFTALLNSMVFRNVVKAKIAPFNDRIWSDVDFVIRAILEFSVILNPVSCTIYQLHSNISHGAHISEYWDMKVAICNMILKSDVVTSLKKHELEGLMNFEMRKFIYNMIYQRFVTKRFDESLQGIEILKTHYCLNAREKIIQSFSRLLLKNTFLVYLFSAVASVKRWVMRFFHFRQLKKTIGKNDYLAFRNLIKKF